MLCQFLLYNKVNQLYIYICSHISSLLRLPPTLPIPPLQVVTEHRADLPVLCGCFPLAIYFTFGSVYMSMPLSHFIPAYQSSQPQHFCKTSQALIISVLVLNVDPRNSQAAPPGLLPAMVPCHRLHPLLPCSLYALLTFLSFQPNLYRK